MHQLTSNDWGTPDEQHDAYEALAEAASEVNADLILVSMPPIEPDEFYADHMDELATAAEAAQNLSAEDEAVEFLDATAVWGTRYSREHDGDIDRSDDGIHTCPQGAARFTSWLLDELSELYPGFQPADPDQWVNTGWSSDETFTGCD